MIRIPDHINQLKIYEQGKDAGDLSLDHVDTFLCSNENNFGPSPLAVEQIKKHLHEIHQFKDPFANGLREELAIKHECEPKNILVGSGIDNLLDLTFRTFVLPGNELLTCKYTYMGIFVLADKNCTSIKRVPMTPEMGLNLTGLKWSLTQQTKLIYISNPNNPTGSILTKDELTAFIKEVPDHIIVLIDEAYHEFADNLHGKYSDSSLLGFKNVLTFRSFSKVHGLAGLRLGYVIGDELLINAMSKAKSPFEPGSLASPAGIGALKDTKHIEKAIKENQSALLQFYQLFDRHNIQYFKSYANFLLIKLENAEKCQEFFEQLLAKGILVRKLSFFGLNEYLRISTGTTKENERFLEVIEELFS